MCASKKTLKVECLADFHLVVSGAIVRKMLTAIWFIFHDNVSYHDYTHDIVTAK